MEYSKDRLNHQIRELQRENSFLRETMFNKDKQLMQVELAYKEADSANRVLSVVLGLTLLGFVCLSLWAINVVGRV